MTAITTSVAAACGLIWTLSALAASAQSPQVVVRLSAATTRPTAAKVTSPPSASNAAATLSDHTVTFAALPADAPLDLSITLQDGTVMQGVDMSWYVPGAIDAQAAPTDDDDQDQIQAIVGVPSFYDRCDILKLRGNHERAVALVQLVRERDFHASGGDVIWRVELWYFENQHGGWAKVQQQNKVLRRERFNSPQAFHQATDKIRWVPELGGIRMKAGAPTSIDLNPSPPKSSDP